MTTQCILQVDYGLEWCVFVTTCVKRQLSCIMCFVAFLTRHPVWEIPKPLPTVNNSSRGSISKTKLSTVPDLQGCQACRGKQRKRAFWMRAQPSPRREKKRWVDLRRRYQHKPQPRKWWWYGSGPIFLNIEQMTCFEIQWKQWEEPRYSMNGSTLLLPAYPALELTANALHVRKPADIRQC